MRPIQPTSRRGIPWGLLCGFLFLLLLSVGGLLGGLWYSGIGLALLFGKQDLGPRIHIPISSQPIAPYTAVTRADLIDRAAGKGTLAFLNIVPEQIVGMTFVAFGSQGQEVKGKVQGFSLAAGRIVIEAETGEKIPAENLQTLGGAIMNVNDIIGRVVAKEKQAGFGFQEDSFLPKGTRPGVAAGIPQGMQALTFAADKLNGVHGLRAGDHIDLLATIPHEHLARFGTPGSGRAADHETAGRPASGAAKGAGESRLLAADAVLVTPVILRAAPMTSSTLTQGKQVRTVPVQEVVIAVRPDDVPGVTEALSLELVLTGLAHTGRPPNKPEDETPAGLVAVPITVQPLAPLSQLVRDDLFDARTRRPRRIFLTPEEVATKRILTNSQELLGRIVARDLAAGQFVTADDLLPPGTPASLAAGVPEGKRAFVIELTKLHGAVALRSGDHFDLLASAAVDLTKSGHGGNSKIIAHGASAAVANLQRQADVRVIVQDGVLVSPILNDSLGGKGSGNGNEKRQPEVVIAVSPAEVAELARALVTQVELSIIARSPHDEKSTTATSLPDTPGHNPLNGLKSLEAIVGRQRDTVLFVRDAAVPQQP